MAYVIQGLDPEPFRPLFSLPPEALAESGAVEVLAQAQDYPCRVSLDHAALGERLLLVNFTHQPAKTPYRSSHAIYVAEGSYVRGVYRDTIPPVMRPRVLSIRAFDEHDMIVDADVVDGAAAEALIRRLLDNPAAAYLHVHFAKRGCFSATITRG